MPDLVWYTQRGTQEAGHGERASIGAGSVPFLDPAPETKTIYFAALKRAIQALEEKRFYDFARMYLETRG